MSTGYRTLRQQDTSAALPNVSLRHIGNAAEVSGSAEVSGHFGSAAEVSQVVFCGSIIDVVSNSRNNLKTYLIILYSVIYVS